MALKTDMKLAGGVPLSGLYVLHTAVAFNKISGEITGMTLIYRDEATRRAHGAAIEAFHKAAAGR